MIGTSGMVKACLRGWGASKQSYSCLGSWVNRLGKFTGPVSILMQTQSTRPKAHWVGRYKWLDNHLQPSTDTNLVYSCLLVVWVYSERLTLRERCSLQLQSSDKQYWVLSHETCCLCSRVWRSVMNGIPSIRLFVCKSSTLKVCFVLRSTN